MASEGYYQANALSPELICIPGAFKFNGSSAVATTQGSGFSVARASAGTFTLTLDKKYVEVISVIARVELDAATTALGEINVKRADTSSRAITLQYVTDDGDGTGTVEDLAAGSNNGNWCHFIIWVRRTPVGSTA